MISQADKARRFAALHVKGEPLILYNIWDAGSAAAVEQAGAQAIATGSWSVAAAYGYADGEKLPLDLAVTNLRRIVAAVDLPVTLDFEGGYAREADALEENVARVIEAGAVGINFEDQIVGGEGLHSIDEQARRIEAIRRAAGVKSIPLFINARTDVFLKAAPQTHNDDHLAEAVARAGAYATAGANGFFAPGVRDIRLIARLCDSVPLPVNILMYPDCPPPDELAEAGVARISYGPFPYRQMIESLKQEARAVLS